jgi:putative tryptophan/tyrosine transport system substrate-binding protein
MRRREFIALLACVWLAPAPAHAQQALPMIGFLSSRSPADSEHALKSFREGLRESGYVEGENVAIEYRWGEGRYDRLPAMAAELVGHPIAVLVAVGGEPAAVAARGATSRIPIVFAVGSDPVQLGFAASYNRPGGNMTGINILSSTLEPKRLGLLHELVPQAQTVAFLLDPNFAPSASQLADVEGAARALGLRVRALRAGDDREIDLAFEAFAGERVGALAIAADPFFDTRREKLVELAARYKLATAYHFREYALAGGLMSYGVDPLDTYRQVGVYAGRVLKGAKPAELPLLQPTKFEFVINLRTAKALGLDVPPGLSARADEVIE